MKTEVLPPSPENLRRATELLRAGEVVALPTETVYGLAADALAGEAVLKIFEAKERPRFDPLIVHLPTLDWLKRLTQGAELPLVRQLADSFWPGPLTLVLPRAAIVPDVVTAGLETVALRMSAHPVFREVVQALGRPLAAPSANRFGRISPTEAAHVRAELEDRIPLIVDGGRTTHGVESTIVAVRGEGLEILRHGPITREQLSHFAAVREAVAGDRPQAPGQLPSHYAPRTPLRLTSDLHAETLPAGRVGALFLQAGEDDPRFAVWRALSRHGDLHEAAANLFRCLRELDAAHLDLIVAERVPEEGIGRAMMDRLRRAAHR